MITREYVICRAQEGALSWREAAKLLGITPRQLRRLRKRYVEEGASGLRDGRRRSGRKRGIGDLERQKVIRLKRERYADFNVMHFYEFAVEKHGLKASYSWTKRVLQQAGLVQKQKKRGVYRRRRQRRPMPGMMLHLDASTHAWLGAVAPEWDLNLVVDDADGRILFGRFVAEEGTLSTLEALWHVLTKHGRFDTLYTDRGSHFIAADKRHETQVQRALKALGVEHIAAHSPEARGRGERVFGTVQDRLVPELRLAGIADYDAANRYLEEVFIPSYNKRFAVEPSCDGTAFCSPPPVDLHLVLSAHSQRRVNKDYTVRFECLKLQLPNSADRPLPRRNVVVHRFIDLSLGISYRGKLLACYDPDGRLSKLPIKPSPRACIPTQPQPTQPDENRRPPDNSDPGFWAFLLGKDKQSQVVSRNDLFKQEWAEPDIY